MIKKYFKTDIYGFLNLMLLVPIFIFYSCSGSNNKRIETNTDAIQDDKPIQQIEESEPSIIPFASNGDIAKVKKLLEKGANVDEIDEGGRTALMYSSFNGLNSVVEELLAHNASVNLKDVNGRTALMFAASGAFPETVKLLLENGAETNIQDEDEHFTAIMFAAAEGQLENVKILLEFGADVSLKDIDGDDALTFAKNNSHQQIVDYLNQL